MAEIKDATRPAVAYHFLEGATNFPYAVDAQSAVGRHPLEWSFDPWTAADADNSRKRLSDKYNNDVALAKSRNLPPPVKPLWIDAEPVQYTPEEQAAIDDHAKAVAAAGERLQKRREELAKQKEIDDQVAADEALVASPPPIPDPAARRPLTPAQVRKAAATLTPAEQADVDARNKAVATPAPPVVMSPAASTPSPILSPSPAPIADAPLK